MSEVEYKANHLTGEIARLEQAMRFARNHDERQSVQRALQSARIELYYLRQYIEA